MAKTTIQEAYINGVTKLNELEELYNKSPKNGEVRRSLLNEITELRLQVTYVKKHLLETERLEYKASEQWKKVTLAMERAVAAQRALFNYDTLKEKVGETEDVMKLKQNIVENLTRIDRKYKGITDEGKISEAVYSVLETAVKAKDEFLGTLSELEEANSAIKTDIYVDEHRSDSEERIALMLEKKRKEEEEAKLISDAEKFRKIVSERNDTWQRICKLNKVALSNRKYSSNARKSVRSLQSSIEKKEKIIKDFIYNFSKNSNYEVSDELEALIGTSKKSDSLQKPTVKQHLDPILKIEEELKNGVSPEREKELKAEKSKREKRLGKKWLIKLKIDKINNRIMQLKELLKGDLSPEDKKKYEKELAHLNRELGVLQKEYGEVLTQIADNIFKTLKKEEKLEQGKDDNGIKKIKEPKPIKDEEVVKTDRNDTGKNKILNSNLDNDLVYSNPGRQVFRAGDGNVVSYGNGSNETISNSNKNLPMVKKESWLDKLKAKFENKEDLKVEPKKEKVEPKVLFTIEVGEDVVNQKLSMIANYRESKVEGKNFYHVVRDDNVLKYVCEPLTNIECTKEALISKIQEVQGKYVEYYKGLYGEQKNNPLFANPNTIARKLIGFSNGLEKRQRVLKAMCSLEAAMHPQEAIDALNGKDTIRFMPGIDGKGEFVELRAFKHLDEGDDLAQYAGKIKYKSNEPLRQMQAVVDDYMEKMKDTFAEHDKNVAKINQKYAQESSKKISFEQASKFLKSIGVDVSTENKEDNVDNDKKLNDVQNIRKNLGAVEPPSGGNVVRFPKNMVKTEKIIQDDKQKTAKNVTPISARKHVPPVPIFNRHRTNSTQKNNDIIER